MLAKSSNNAASSFARARSLEGKRRDAAWRELSSSTGKPLTLDCWFSCARSALAVNNLTHRLYYCPVALGSGNVQRNARGLFIRKIVFFFFFFLMGRLAMVSMAVAIGQHTGAGQSPHT